MGSGICVRMNESHWRYVIDHEIIADDYIDLQRFALLP